MKYKKEVSAGGIVYKRDGSKTLWLVTQHSQHKSWSFPKGLVGDTNENEKLEEAALREVQEEGGIKAMIVNETPQEVNYTYRSDQYIVKKTVYYFLMKYISGDPTDHDWEVSEATFINEEEVLTTLSFKTDKEAYKKTLKIFKN